MGQGFFIDVDYEMKDSKMAADMTKKVIEWHRESQCGANFIVVEVVEKFVIDFEYDIKEHLKQSTAKRINADAWTHI